MTPMKPIHLIGRSLWAPHYPSRDAFLGGEPLEEAARPPVAFVGSRKKRGASILTLASAEVAMQAAQSCEIDPSAPALVFGSCHGEMEIAVAQMRMFQEPGGLLSPQRFKNSVHNTGAGMFSIAVDNQGFATAIAAGHDTLAMSLLDAWLLLDRGEYETAIVVVADEELPEPVTHFSPHKALAIGLVLSTQPAPGALTLSNLRLDPEAGFAGDGYFGGNPAAPALPFVRGAFAGETTLPLSLAGGQPWAVTVTPS